MKTASNRLILTSAVFQVVARTSGRRAEDEERKKNIVFFFVSISCSVLQEAPCCWWRRCSTRTARARSPCSSTPSTCWFRRREGRGRPLSTLPCWPPPASPTSSTASPGRSTTPCWDTKRCSRKSAKLMKNCSEKKMFHLILISS